MRGTFRIQTEAEVKVQNATEVVQATPPVYVWEIEGVEKASPRLVLVARP